VDEALQAAKQQFLQQYGSGYGYSGWLEQHYQQEVGYRLGPGKHYLDYTGAALYPASLLEAVYKDLLTQTYGNPHSAAAPPATPMTSAGNTGTANSSSTNSSSSSGPGGAGAPGAVATPPAAASEAVMEAAAAAVLEHLHADPADYQVVFTR
jgi:selenocysteine lyase/cysteine desulfurase